MRRQAGVTLIEVLIAITLLGLLTTAMLFAMRVGLMAFSKTDTKLMDNRRVVGAQRVVEQELEGLMPVIAPCGGPGMKAAFFQGEAQTMRLVSTFTLQQAWRGQPQILELFVIPGEQQGVRLVVNEIPYTGPEEAGQICPAMTQDVESGLPVPRFAPVVAGPNSFVLADKLAYCRFVYLAPAVVPFGPEIWTAHWVKAGWPLAVRIEMAPLEPDPSRLQPITVVAPIFIRRAVDGIYADN
jgi:prepilin-type N-terminal cleavage/methylation domain-containing protein